MLRAIVLKLACLHPDDKSSILKQLSTTEKASIDNLLKDIQALGLTTDPTIANIALADLRENIARIKENELGIAHLDIFWQRILLSKEDQNRFIRLLNIEDLNDSVEKFQEVPKKLFNLVESYAKRQVS